MEKWLRDLLLLCGDVELNPGPCCMRVSETDGKVRPNRSSISLASIRSTIEKRRRSIYIEPTPLWSSCRLILAFMGFLGFVNVYAMRVNMSVAMVCMLNQTAIRQAMTAGHNETLDDFVNFTAETDASENNKCSNGLENGGNSTLENEDGEFAWPKETQGLILGSFFWGYMTTQILGGWLSSLFGGKRVFGWFMCSCAIFTLLMPVAARIDYRFLMVLRFLAGVGQGVVFPAMNVLWANWAPPLERSKLGGFTYSGSQLGNVITFPLAGLLCAYGFDGGWPSVFYVLGACGLVWFAGWTFLVYDSPSEHPRISSSERNYITTSLKGNMAANRQASKHVPWLTLLTSLPVWGIVATHTCSNFGTYLFLTNMPTYMSEVLHFDIKSNGLLSALPYIGFWLAIVVSGQLADLVRSRGILTTTHTRKVGNSIGMMGPGIFVAALGYMTCEQSTTAVTIMTIGISLSGFQYGSGWMVNPVDIAPKYAGVIFGISNTFATIPGFVAPWAVGLMTTNQTREEWQTVFFVATAIYFVGALAYILLGSGELQEWARQDYADDSQGKPLEDAEKSFNDPENGAGDAEVKGVPETGALLAGESRQQGNSFSRTKKLSGLKSVGFSDHERADGKDTMSKLEDKSGRGEGGYNSSTKKKGQIGRSDDRGKSPPDDTGAVEDRGRQISDRNSLEMEDESVNWKRLSELGNGTPDDGRNNPDMHEPVSKKEEVKFY